MTVPQVLSDMTLALEAHLATVQSFTAETEALLAALPERNRNWSIGEAGLVQPEHLAEWHGDPLQDDSWLDLFREHNPQPAPEDELCLILPSQLMFACVVTHNNQSLSHLSESYPRVRILVEGPLDTQGEKLAEQFFTRGHDARVHSRLPVFMCADNRFHLSCPDPDDLTQPNRMHLVNSPLIAGITNSLFENLWTEAQTLPHRKHRQEWSGLLELLFRGETLETAANELGCSSRTVKQRLNAAYAHYGVDNIFDLGLAWGANIAENRKSGF